MKKKFIKEYEKRLRLMLKYKLTGRNKVMTKILGILHL